MKPLSEVAPGLLDIQIQIHAVCNSQASQSSTHVVHLPNMYLRLLYMMIEKRLEIDLSSDWIWIR